ncbi:glutaredoxin family protein [Arenimonas sp.]|uniref:glutaredoxin family protein n=1 Tax=Arenimonas sp. TaxID=1872635 RepID=UPI002E33B71D|nr:glutaredoxin family protein [Arenimonas sp.]HEX4854402.1 glutaredoxin family protein [Arenimonas sp.]
MPLTLIQRDDCHLCDQAWEQLAAAGVVDFESLWIDGDAVLEARYGLRIPVLRREADGAELDWPFSGEAVRRFLAG